MYKFIKNHGIINFIERVSDGAWIPLDEDNVDYKKYLIWISEGNTAEIIEL